MDNDVVTLIARALDMTDAIIRGVEDAAWDEPTPCDGWDVQDVVNHLVGGALIFAAQLEGSPSPGEHEADWLGDDSVAAWTAAAAADRAAWTADGALDATVTISIGTLPGELAAWVHLTEVVVHGVDVAVSTGQVEKIDQALAEQLLGAMQALGFEAFRTADAFGPELDVAAPATPHERLLAYLGRAVMTPGLVLS